MLGGPNAAAPPPPLPGSHHGPGNREEIKVEPNPPTVLNSLGRTPHIANKRCRNSRLRMSVGCCEMGRAGCNPPPNWGGQAGPQGHGGLLPCPSPPGKRSWCSPSLGDMGDKSCRVSVMGGTQHQPSPGDSRFQGGPHPVPQPHVDPTTAQTPRERLTGRCSLLGGDTSWGAAGPAPTPPQPPRTGAPWEQGQRLQYLPPRQGRTCPAPLSPPSEAGTGLSCKEQQDSGRWPHHGVPTTTVSPPPRQAPRGGDKGQ